MNAPKPYKENALFCGDPDYHHMNACVGRNGGPYRYDSYADGYLRAAIAIVSSAESYQNPVDIMVYPIAYCFRHSIELYLKHFCKFLPRLYGETDSPVLTHKLLDNWGTVKEYFLRDPKLTNGQASIDQFEAILKDFIEVDPSGEIFRFPENRSGEPHLMEYSLINVLVLKSAMLEAHNILESWSRMARATYDYKTDYGLL